MIYYTNLLPIISNYVNKNKYLKMLFEIMITLKFIY